MSKKPVTALRRGAAEIKRYRTILKITPIVIGIIATLLVLVYIITTLYSKYGSFTVSIPKYDSMKYALSLSFTRDFDEPSSVLNAKVATDITNIDGETLPKDLDTTDGVYHEDGMNFAAYTFYCKNAGTETITLHYNLFIANATLGIEKAVRVRLYVNGEETTYARTASDGSGPEPGTKEFKTNTIIVEQDIKNFSPETEPVRFTVVIWLEGNDPDCVDRIIGGQLKVAMTLSCIGVNADTVNPDSED